MCQNPFFECKTKQAKIVVDIIYKGVRYEICETCWSSLAESDITWEQPRPRIDEARDLRKWTTE